MALPLEVDVVFVCGDKVVVLEFELPQCCAALERFEARPRVAARIPRVAGWMPS